MNVFEIGYNQFRFSTKPTQNLKTLGHTHPRNEGEKSIAMQTKFPPHAVAMILLLFFALPSAASSYIRHGDVNTPQKHSNGDRMPLHCAAIDGNVAAVRELLDLGAHINAENHLSDGPFTALQWAAYKAHADVVELLIQRGARLHYVSWRDCSLLYQEGVTVPNHGVLISNGAGLRIVQLLVQAGANIEKDRVLFNFASQCKLDGVNFLLGLGADPRTIYYGGTALSNAEQGPSRYTPRDAGGGSFSSERFPCSDEIIRILKVSTLQREWEVSKIDAEDTLRQAANNIGNAHARYKSIKELQARIPGATLERIRGALKIYNFDFEATAKFLSRLASSNEEL